MAVLESTILIPTMTWLADTEEVHDAAFDCPLVEHIEFDLASHTARVQYTGAEALEEILLNLANAGYPAIQA